MAVHRYYIDTFGTDDEAYREAMQFACALANKFPDVTRVILWIGQKGNDGWFGRLFDDKTVKQLYQGMRFNKCRPVFKFETVKTYNDQYDKQKDIVIACGRDADDLFKIDDFGCVHSIIAIPWLKESTQPWVDTWNPTDIRSGKAENEPPEISCIVQKAMEDLSDSINMSTGIRHHADEDLAKTYILALHSEGEINDGAAVRGHLVRDRGWSAEHAQDVYDLIDKLNSGKHFKGGSRDKESWEYHIKRWREECAQ